MSQKEAKKTNPKATDALSVFSRQIADMDWLQQSLHTQMRLNIAILSVLAVVVVVTLISFLVRPEPRYFASTSDLRVIELKPLDRPSMSSQGLSTWVADTVVRALSLNFNHSAKILQSVQADFSHDAFIEFVTSLKKDGLYDKVLTQRLSLTVVPQSAPVIVNEGVLNGVYAWRVKFPVIVSYEGSQGSLGNQTYKVTVLVQSAPLDKFPRGVAIQQLVLE